MIVFLDTNILLDILIANRPTHKESLQILQLNKLGKIQCMITTQSIIDAAYVHTQRMKSPVAAFKKAIQKISHYVSTISISIDDIQRTNTSPISDYEDAAQIFCAADNGCDVIVSNDKKFCSFTDITVLTPGDFIQHCLKQENL